MSINQSYENSQVYQPDAPIFERQEPEELPNDLPPLEPFLLSLLPEVFQPWLEDIAERIQCPIDFPAAGAMVVLASIVGRQVGIRPKAEDDWLMTPNL